MEELRSIVQSGFEMSQLTGECRWLQQRDSKPPKLQQAYRITVYGPDHKATDSRIEWRDIPTVEL